MIARVFADCLLRWVRGDPQVGARSFEEAGYRDTRYGVQLRLPTQALIHLQTPGCAPLMPGADPVGPLVPCADPVRLPADGPTDLHLVERWVAWRITQAACPQVAAVRLLQDRPPAARSVPYGLGVDFHDGARAWVYFRHCTPAGRAAGSGPVWRAQPTV